MKTFPLEPKAFYIARLQQHMDADELIRGEGYENGRGCAVGCILNRYNHNAFEAELGLPEWFARLLDHLHENTSKSYWPTFAIRLLKSIPEGVDVEPVENKLLKFIQLGNIEHVKTLDIDTSLKTKIIGAIELVIQYLVSNATQSAAYAAARSAADAARSAVYDADAAACIAAYASWSVVDKDLIADELIRLLQELKA